MDLEQKDKGVIAVMLKRFEHESYPKILLLEEKVNDGGVLDEADQHYLEKILSDAHQAIAILTRHPEYAPLANKVLMMYEDIMNKSQKNSQ